jgi:hypothetical protein
MLIYNKKLYLSFLIIFPVIPKNHFCHSERSEESQSSFLQNDSDNWISGWGWNQELWNNKEFPTKNELDEIFPNTPVYLPE